MAAPMIEVSAVVRPGGGVQPAVVHERATGHRPRFGSFLFAVADVCAVSQDPGAGGRDVVEHSCAALEGLCVACSDSGVRHDCSHERRRVVSVVRRHLASAGAPRRRLGLFGMLPEPHSGDGQVDERRGHPLELPRARHDGRIALWVPRTPLRCGRSQGRGAVLLDSVLNVIVAEIVKEAVASQDEDVPVLHGGRAHHGTLDHRVGVGVAEAMQALHLHGAPGVIAPRLSLEDGPQAEGPEAARAQDQEGTVPEAGRDEIRVPQGGQQ
mmetsp:Transcript_43144/g.99960  ORF Transcript_43144/g.99960 Transcript_43144/m.99960 type:complete len:268 (+) Transcript_43144:375-1178(+)